MRLQEGHTPYTRFDADIIDNHPPSIPGPIALRRCDTQALISLRDTFIGEDRVYDILDASEEEKERLRESGILLV
jgi:hypothetical protein